MATVDFITPLVDDPVAFGAIAAANAVSDVYAMGARPVAALSIACFPSKQWPLETLGEILRGGAETLGSTGTPVVGGHTVEDPEMKVGYAVMGLAAADSLWRNSRALPGDLLLLTKRLGTGILAAAARAGEPVGPAWDAAILQMRQTNRNAAEVLASTVVHAVTDVSGFGLAGHAAEVARGSRATLRLHAQALPLLDGALHWARRGHLTRARAANRAYVADRFRQARDVDPAVVEAFFDPQTSGGLLVAVPPGSDALDRLRAAGSDATVIGEVEPPSDVDMVLD